MLRLPARSLIGLALTTIPLLASHAGAQQPTLAGSWSATPMSEVVNVKSWPSFCGAKPASSSSPGGGYKISLAGDELVFSGGRAFRTDQCWDMTSAKRVSHSATPSIRYWKTRCESPAGDPRKAAITTVVRAVDDDTIVFSETAHYTLTVAEGDCNASIERSRTFKLVSREGAAPAASPSPTPTAAPTATPTPTPTAAPKPTIDCSTVGEATALEVRPRRKVVRPGEQFDFHARIIDSKGCDVGGKTTFRLAPESSSVSTITVDASGRVKVAADAEPVTATLLAEGAGKSAKVELEVVSDQKYAELLAAGAGDAGSDEQSVAVVLESSGGGGKATVVDSGKPESRSRFAWLAIAGGLCSLLALGAIVLWRRGNAQAQRAAAELEERRAQRDAEEAARRAAVQQQAAAAAAAAAARPIPQPTAPAPAAAPRPKGRICPICGTRYEGEAAFCSKDGIALVPLN